MKKPFLVLFTIAILALFLSNSAMVGAQDDGPMSPDMPDLPDHYHTKITEAAVAILPKEIRKEVNFNVWPSGDYAGSATVIAGSYEEDHPKEELPYWHHSWDPDLNDYWYSSAVHEVPGSSAGTALDWADYYFNQAIYKYRLDKKTAYFYLGRTAHLLGDMATPAHVHMDAHYPCKDIVGEKAARLCDLHQKIFPDDIPDSDKYEKYLGRLSGEDTLPPMSFTTWDYRSIRTLIPSELGPQLDRYNKTGGAEDTVEDLWSNGPVVFTKGDPLFSDRRVDYDLFHIFYDMAETADNYASNDVHGETTSNGHRNVDSDYEAIRNSLVPHSISKIAALIQLFWDRTHASPNVDVILIIDSSGSMGSNDRYNKRLDAARTYLTASVPGDYVGVVDFDSYANLVGPLQHAHDNKEALTTAIETINSSGGTNIGAGIQLACDTLLASTSGNTEKAAILLTDGNGSFSGEDTCFADQRWPIYTFGFGSANDTLLRDISMRTGGEFRRLDTSSFICKFQAVRTKIASGVPGECNSDNISPLETIKHLFTVPKVQLQLTVSTSWLGSDVELSLVSPSGRVINRDTVAPDVVHDLGATFESYTVSNPEAGEWEMILYGADIPEGGEEVVFNHTTVPIPASDLGAIIIKKRAPYDVEESFDFTGDLGSFAIKHKETASFDRLAAGEYMVKELVPDGWNLDVVECGDSNVAVVDDGVKIKLDAGDSVTCIFRNSKTAKVTIGKKAPEGVDKKFRFAGDLGTFGLRHKETKVFENVAAGEYVVTEVERAGWRMESVDCRNADVAIAANGVKIKLDEGEKVLCTFLNSPADFHGSIFMPMVSGQ